MYVKGLMTVFQVGESIPIVITELLASKIQNHFAADIRIKMVNKGKK